MTTTPTKKKTAFNALLTPSPELAKIVGVEPLERTEVVKRMWVYIKAHGLQDATNKRVINADPTLAAVFGQPSTDMFQMTKLVGPHLTKAPVEAQA